MNLIQAFFSVSFLFSIIRVTTPILYASMSSIVSEDCGIPNIGIEGIMLMSALVGVVSSAAAGANAWVGFLCAVAVGVAMALLLGFLVMKLQCDPTIAGIAFNLTGAGASIFFLFLASGEKGNSASLQSGVLPTVHIPFVQDIPVVGNILSGHNLLTYVVFLLVPVLSYVLYKTRFGIHLRSAGESPEALASVGVSVTRVKYSAMALSGLFAAMAGAYMSMGYVSYFVGDMTAGRGFIAIAASSLGNRRPGPVLLACLLFGVADAFASNTATQSMGIPSELVGCIPYVITIVALVIYSYRRKKQRRRLGVAAN